MSSKKQLKNEIIDAVCHLRNTAKNIPSSTIELMKTSALEKIEYIPKEENDFKMEAKDWRIGNVYTTENIDYGIVEADDFMNWHVNGCWAQGVVLTEEWLLKLGFKEEHLDGLNKVFVKKDFAVKLQAQNHFIFRYLSVDANDFKWVCLYGTECKYVHHLQNAYSALMRWEELTIVK